MQLGETRSRSHTFSLICISRLLERFLLPGMPSLSSLAIESRCQTMSTLTWFKRREEALRRIGHTRFNSNTCHAILIPITKGNQEAVTLSRLTIRKQPGPLLSGTVQSGTFLTFTTPRVHSGIRNSIKLPVPVLP